MTAAGNQSAHHEPRSGEERARVALVFGGVSTEHGVSCLTAASIAAAIDPDRYEVVGIGITPDGLWVRVPVDEITALDAKDDDLPSVSPHHPECHLLRRADGPRLVTVDAGTLRDETPIDVAFSLLHGPFGEDGTVQGMFEMLGVRYVGSGVAASANGMDKHLMKTAFADAGLPVGPYTVITPADWENHPDEARGRVEALGFPVFVKPARGGSSVGISRVKRLEELDDALLEARRHDPKVVVEAGFVGARELECAVLGSFEGPPRASAISEIVMHTNDGFYDFESKYNPAEGAMELVVPANLPEETTEALRRLAAWAFTAMGCEGLARVDCFLTAENELFVNEINTMPGMTEFSGYPKMWQAAGMPYRELVTELIELGLHRPLGLR